jgi:hypothetical protein
MTDAKLDPTDTATRAITDKPVIDSLLDHPDVVAAFAGHCCSTHFDGDGVRECPYCSRLRETLTNTLAEWAEVVLAARVERASDDLKGRGSTD